ncbi:MAG TPA: hypothetical protein VH396_10235 [Chitinophagaceae bacterium]|jgi:hypothetical protein
MKQNQRNCVYISYNETTYGNFKEAVQISNHNEYVVWAEASRFDVKKIKFLKYILIAIKGKDRFYFGDLLEVQPYDPTIMANILKEHKHRPFSWRSRSPDAVSTLLYIGNLKEVPEPDKVKSKKRPQRPCYITLQVEKI